ncbi:MAG: restriction endonuclease subunit S [Trichlorobacter sp.]|uniref:restriction endonuclease subunit S n=1 Tax=Trichlorobacter sp. TaxID=2911007 RepID=UPI00255E5A26|nr:restriction endonuclease subunit S [Trichlorobacter sp.]MDK9717690.1 restriction endonuclease subunit S [Trichlorobacter sp.]
MNTITTITDNLELWTSALLSKSTAGRGSNGKLEAYGIKKLRELILELAVRGKLVPQDPNDEPASALLQRIAQEKARLIKEGVIRREPCHSEIIDEERPYQLPTSWGWVRLTDVYYSISPSGKKLKSSEIINVGTYPVVDQGQSYIAGYTNEAGLLITIPGPVIIFGDHTTEIKYVDFDFVAGADGTKILRPYLMCERFFYTYLKSYKLEDRGYTRHFKVLNENLMALPPLAEQYRIVAKVDELMALCDQLEQQQTNNIEAHQTLVEVVLGTLTSVESPQELTEAWNRIGDHFDTLFTTEQSIDQLKQTILQLAVMGKLVPQDPDDEPASVLLKKLKSKLKPKKLSADYEDAPFKLPTGWAWLRLGELGEIFGGGTPSKSNPKFWCGQIPWVSPKDMKVDFISSSQDTISEEALNGSAVKLIPAGSLLIVVRGMILAHSFPVAITRAPVTVNQDMKAIVFSGFDQNFVLLMVKAFKDSFVAMVDLSTHGTCKLVSEKLWAKKLPIPPLAEQHHIVAKVDELMSLCDALKARLAAAQTTQIHLADTIVEQAVA